MDTSIKIKHGIHKKSYTSVKIETLNKVKSIYEASKLLNILQNYIKENNISVKHDKIDDINDKIENIWHVLSTDDIYVFVNLYC